MAFALTTIAAVVVRIKDIVPELKTAADARLLRSTNDAIRFLINENTSRNMRFRLCTADDDLGTDGLVALPDDLMALKSVYRLDSDTGLYIPSLEVERTELLEFDAALKTYASKESYYAFRGHTIDTRPKESATLTDGIRLEYYTMPEDKGSNDSLDAFLERWRELIAYYVARKEDIRNEDRRRELNEHFSMLLTQYTRSSRRSWDQPKVMGSVRSGAGGNKARQRRKFGRIS